MRNRSLEGASGILITSLILGACAPIVANPNTNTDTHQEQTSGEPPYPVPGLEGYNLPPIATAAPIAICDVSGYHFAGTIIHLEDDVMNSELRSDVESTFNTITTLLDRSNYCYVSHTAELGDFISRIQPASDLVVAVASAEEDSVIHSGVGETTTYVNTLDGEYNPIVREAKVPIVRLNLNSRVDAVYTSAYAYYLSANPMRYSLANGSSYNLQDVHNRWEAQRFAATITVIMSEKLGFPIDDKIFGWCSQELYNTLKAGME